MAAVVIIGDWRDLRIEMLHKNQSNKLQAITVYAVIFTYN